MGKQTGDIKITGTFHNICFYKMGEGHYVRTKSSLDGERFWKANEFEGSRKSCGRFGAGNKLASEVYNSIPKEERKYEDFCYMKSKAIILVKQGLTREEILDALRNLIPAKKTMQLKKTAKKRAGEIRKKETVHTYNSVFKVRTLRKSSNIIKGNYVIPGEEIRT